MSIYHGNYCLPFMGHIIELSVRGSPNGTIGNFTNGTIGSQWLTNGACVHGSTNGTNGRPIPFKVLPMVPLVIPLVPMVPLVKTDGSQYCRQSTVWAKLPTFESHMIKYGVLNFKFINFTNKHGFYQDDIRK